MNDIEKKIEELKSEFSGKLEALRKEAEAQKKQEEWKPWKPETEEKYFFVDNDFFPHSFCNQDDEVDSYNFEIGNCFRTEERAERVAKKMRLLLRMEQLHDMLCPDYVPDWGNYGQKFLVYFNHAKNCWDIRVFTTFELRCATYFDTKENAKKAAEILNKELEESK